MRRSIVPGSWVAAALLAAQVSFAQVDISPAEARALCFELGATPEALTALGFSLSTTQQALARLSEQDQAAAAFRQHQLQLAALESALRSLRAEARAVVEPADLQQITAQITQKQAEIATARAEMAAARGQLVSALAGSTVSASDANRVFTSTALPAAYRVAELTDAQAAELRAALAAERHAQARGQTPGAQTQQTLAAYRAIPDVAAALASQAAHLGTVRQLFYITD